MFFEKIEIIILNVLISEKNESFHVPILVKNIEFRSSFRSLKIESIPRIVRNTFLNTIVYDR